MISEKILEAIEQQLIARELSSCERYIVAKSWEGDRYEKIARESGYDKNYVKQVSAKLWSELSSVTGKNITKKNLRIVFELPIKADQPKQTTQTQFEPTLNDVATEEINFPSSPVVANSSLYINRPPTKDFFSMLRFWHERSKDNSLWQLRLVLVYSTDTYVRFNLNQSPIKVGLAIKLPLFTFAQTVELAKRYGLNLEFTEEGLVENIYQLLIFSIGKKFI